MEECRDCYTCYLIIAQSDIRTEMLPIYARDADHARELAYDWLHPRRHALPIVTVVECSGGLTFDPCVTHPASGMISLAGQFTRELAEGLGKVPRR